MFVSSLCSVGKFLIFVITAETHSIMDLLCFPWQPQSAHCLQGLDTRLICFFIF